MEGAPAPLIIAFDFVKYDEILKRGSVVKGSGTKKSKTYEANKNN